MISFSIDDHRHMARALELAARGRYGTAPNPLVGAVLVRDGTVVGEGFHARAGGPHAEAAALAAAGDAARGATLYVSLEPCCHTGRTPPCTRAILAAGVARVVAAMHDPNPRVAGGGLRELASAGVDTACGLMEAHALDLNPGFVSRMRRARPWVRIKLAMSLDGRTAMANGESRWITGPAARRDVQHWRALSGAVLTGIGTVLADDPGLHVRAEDMDDEARALAEPVRQPLRVILDSSFRTPVGARTLAQDGTVLIAGTGDPRRASAALRERAELLAVEGSAGRPALGALLQRLAAREVNDVLVEAGPTLAGAFVHAGLADELIVYLAPTLLGDLARPLLVLPGIERMSQQLRLELLETREVGGDLRLRLRPVAGPPPAATP
jgi:diaminohydroxyphosphoribosylaminopyrimidine deaminase/5-amino-6-(5-phosphoribosylamino)uracil reductase